MDKEKAIAVLKKYNETPFLLMHGLTVGGVMKYVAEQIGYAEESEYWRCVGILHDVDYEKYPESHCVMAEKILREEGADEDFIYSVCSHGYGLTESKREPKHEMEKVLFAIDELTGLIGAGARMRPSHSTLDMEVGSIKKKFKDKRFAAGCSREVIMQGAERLGWELDRLFELTLKGMQSCEEENLKILE